VAEDWEAKVTKRPVAGAFTEVFVPVVVPVVVEQGKPVVWLYKLVEVQPAGRVEPVVVVVVVVVVDVDVVLKELTKARVLGPK
jgi:hypothetical protein